jgi:large subunit ribosomal protein L35
MPKMKTHSGTAKRVKKTASGEFKRTKANTGHLFSAKPTKGKRQNRKSTMVSSSDMKRIKQQLTNIK